MTENTNIVLYYYSRNPNNAIYFISKANLNFAARLHENLITTITGTLSLIILEDRWIRELVEYHKLTSICCNNIKEDTKFWGIRADKWF